MLVNQIKAHAFINRIDRKCILTNFNCVGVLCPPKWQNDREVFRIDL